MKEYKLSIFMGWIANNHCAIYSQIYEFIYRKAGYKKYSSVKFVMKFNTDLSEFVKMAKNKYLEGL
jgi:hypothetical protein